MKIRAGIFYFFELVLTIAGIIAIAVGFNKIDYEGDCWVIGGFVAITLSIIIFCLGFSKREKVLVGRESASRKMTVSNILLGKDKRTLKITCTDGEVIEAEQRRVKICDIGKDVNKTLLIVDLKNNYRYKSILVAWPIIAEVKTFYTLSVPHDLALAIKSMLEGR